MHSACYIWPTDKAYRGVLVINGYCNFISKWFFHEWLIQNSMILSKSFSVKQISTTFHKKEFVHNLQTDLKLFFKSCGNLVDIWTLVNGNALMWLAGSSCTEFLHCLCFLLQFLCVFVSYFHNVQMVYVTWLYEEMIYIFGEILITISYLREISMNIQHHAPTYNMLTHWGWVKNHHWFR